jgi:hypothetical protein
MEIILTNYFKSKQSLKNIVKFASQQIEKAKGLEDGSS